MQSWRSSAFSYAPARERLVGACCRTPSSRGTRPGSALNTRPALATTAESRSEIVLLSGGPFEA